MDLPYALVTFTWHSYWKWLNMTVDLPNLGMVMFHSYVSLPEGNPNIHMISPSLSNDYPNINPYDDDDYIYSL